MTRMGSIAAVCMGFVLFVQTEVAQERVMGRVIGVKDGDTIELLVQGQPVVVRLAHVDCPELKGGQPYGQAAKRYMSDRCFGKEVTIRHQGTKDRNGRLIGEVINAAGENINQQLVAAGMAWHFKRYSDDLQYAVLEIRARQAKRGLWQDPNPIAPWDWRSNRNKPKK